MDTESRQKLLLVLIVIASIAFFTILIFRLSKTDEPTGEIDITLDDTQTIEVKRDKTPSLSDLFNQAFSKTQPNSSNIDNPHILDSQLTGPTPKLKNPLDEGSCEIYNQEVPEGVVIFDTTCTPDNKTE